MLNQDTQDPRDMKECHESDKVKGANYKAYLQKSDFFCIMQQKISNKFRKQCGS